MVVQPQQAGRPTLAAFIEKNKGSIRADVEWLYRRFRGKFGTEEIEAVYMEVLRRLFAEARMTDFLLIMVMRKCKKAMAHHLRIRAQPEPFVEAPQGE